MVGMIYNSRDAVGPSDTVSANNTTYSGKYVCRYVYGRASLFIIVNTATCAPRTCFDPRTCRLFNYNGNCFATPPESYSR